MRIWEGDPLGDCGCGCSPVSVSMSMAQRIMDEIKQQNATVEQLKSEFNQIKVVRDMVNLRRPRSGYPDHVREILNRDGRPPLFFFDGKLIHSGTFPNYVELKKLVATILG